MVVSACEAQVQNERSLLTFMKTLSFKQHFTISLACDKTAQTSDNGPASLGVLGYSPTTLLITTSYHYF
jgi:hypothetical protein